MAKEKTSGTEIQIEKLVETAQDNDFGERESAPKLRNRVFDREAGLTVEDSIEAIRSRREAQRKIRGREGRKRTITHYHDAERLANLARLGFNVVTNEELVDCEEAGLLPGPDPATPGGLVAASAVDDLPPDEG